MKLSLVRFGGGHAEVPANIQKKMATSWYVRHFNSYTTQGRANSVFAVLGGWFIFGYTLKKWLGSGEPKKSASGTSAAAPSSAKKSGHH